MMFLRSVSAFLLAVPTAVHSFAPPHLQLQKQRRETTVLSLSDQTEEKKASSRWSQLAPRVKARIVQRGRDRAIANKKKRESKHDKKRQMMMFVKDKQREKKQAARVQRPLPFDDRTPLSALIPGMEITGVVISLTPFGAYIDVGTECDGLLHVSQMSATGAFVEHARQVLEPGEEVRVRVRSTNPLRKKLHLTMKTMEELKEEEADVKEDRIPLNEIEVDDELWGEIRRVTAFGAYIEVGAVVDGFLHFMDHPLWSHGETPDTIMESGQRVRVWVTSVDLEQNRIKLTAVRPSNLAGPRREFQLNP